MGPKHSVLEKEENMEREKEENMEREKEEMVSESAADFLLCTTAA